MTHKTQPTAHAEITAPISADLRRLPELSGQDAGLLEQAASMLEGLHDDERNRGNCSTAEGAACSAHAVRRLAFQLLRAAPPAPAAVAVPDGFALVPKRLTRAMERVLSADEEGWQWEDLLAAAEAITEQEYAALAAAPAQAVAVPEVADAQIDWDELPEDAGERAMFDRNLDLYGGDPRAAIAAALRIWANTRGNGSFGAQCAVMANEVAKLHLASAPAQEHATQLAGHGQDLIGIAETWEQSADDAEACKSERSQPDYNDGLVAGMRQCAANLRAAAPAQAQEDARDALTQAARDVLAERQRQITNEGRSADADDLYQARELAAAAATYVLMAGGLQIEHAWARWPWPAGLKEGTPRRMLEKAGALILAEMERLDRAAARAAQGGA